MCFFLLLIIAIVYIAASERDIGFLQWPEARLDQQSRDKIALLLAIGVKP
jgi:hypothetical protein